MKNCVINALLKTNFCFHLGEHKFFHLIVKSILDNDYLTPYNIFFSFQELEHRLI